MTPEAAPPSRPSHRILPTAAAVAALIALTAVAFLAEYRARPPLGVSATYFAGMNWTGPVHVRTIDADISTARLDERWPWLEEPFSVRWEGYLAIHREGVYRVATRSDDGSWMFLDGELVVDNGGNHEPRLKTAERVLSPGLHALKVEYFQNRGGREINLLIARQGERLAPVGPTELVSVETPARDLARWRAVLAVRNTLLGFTTGVHALCALLVIVVLPVRWLVAQEVPQGLAGNIRWLLAVVALVYGVGLWWGVHPKGGTWAPDELTPGDLRNAIDARFSNGWTHKYPPGHFYVVAAVSAPLLAADYFGRGTFDSAVADAGILSLARLTSVAMAVSSLLVLYLWARRLMDSAASFIAVCAFAAMPPMVFYSKTANLDVPYVYWSFIALLAYARLLDRVSRRDYVLYACAAVAAVCTKDQSYGIFALPTLAIVWRHYRQTGRTNVWNRLRRSVFSADALGAATVAVLLFVVCHNIVFNLAGFLAHVDGIAGEQSQNYRVFASDLTGQWEMLKATVWLIMLVMTPGVFVLCVIGIAVAFANRRRQRSAKLGWAGLAAFSYYITFIAVIGYNYDRFLIPICAVLALFVGVAGGFLRGLHGRPGIVATGAIALCLGFASVRALALDLAMVLDSRYTVQSWARANIDEGQRVGMIGYPEYLPHVDNPDVVGLTPSEQELRDLSLDFVVVNADFVHRFAPGSEEERTYSRLRDGNGGYQMVFSRPAGYPLAPLSYQQHLGARGEQFSNLTKISPAILVFARVHAR